MKLWTVLAELGVTDYAVSDAASLDEGVYPADLAQDTEFIRHGLSLVKAKGPAASDVVLAEEGFTLVYLGGELPVACRAPRRREVLIAAGCSWDELCLRFSNLSRAIAQLSIRQDLLMQSFARTTNLEWFVSRVAKIVGNPLVLVNTDGKILAVSRELREAAPNSTDDLRGGFISPTAMEELRSDKILDRISLARHAVVEHNDRYDQTWAFSALVRGSNTLGHLDVLGRNRPFTPSDLELIDDASDLLCVVVQYGGLGGSFAGAGSSVLADLVEGDIPDREALEDQLSQTVLPVASEKTTYLLLSLVASDESFAPGFRAHVAGLLTSEFPHCLWSYVHGCFVVLVGLPEGECEGLGDYEAAERFLMSRKALVEALPRYGLYCFAAEPFCDLLDVPGRFKQCSLLADALMGRCEDKTVFSFWRHRFDILANLASGSNLAEVLIDQRVRNMARYDRVHRTSYLKTAEMSVRFPGAPTEAAAALHVHRNTYFYRTGKVFDLFNLDLKDGDDRLAVALAAHLLAAGLELEG